MQKAKSPRLNWRNIVFILVAFLVVAADQLTKLWIRSFPEGQLIFKAEFFQVVHIHNTGAAFGIFQDKSFALTIIGIAGIGVILALVFLFSHRLTFLNSWLNKIVLGLVLGGTTGNLIDRIRLGSVTDFIDVGIWPLFNIADSAIVVGAVLFVYSLVFLAKISN